VNSKTIARNTAWYGLENVIGFVTSMVTSIAIARTLGPAEMGYIIYVAWLATIVSSLGSVGIPATTRKYMAEFLGAGRFAPARYIYFRTFAIQAVLATIATALAIVWVLHDSPANYRVAAILLVLSIWPAMVNFISAQANVAAENLSANLPASAASTGVFFVMTFMAIFFHWGVIGIAAAMLGMRVVDFLVRIVPTLRNILSWESGEVDMPSDLRPRMMNFAFQSVMSMVLTLIVWDRSELFLLKHLSTDIRQVAFYSVAFGLAERLLVFPTVFAGAVGTTIFAQYGRDRTKLPAMTAASVRYLALLSIPLHVIATSLAAPVLLTLYGKQYAGALLVATIAPLLCLPKAFLGPIQDLFASEDAQKYFLVATILSSFIDVGVAWYFIPTLGAVGACLGSGTAQIIAVGLMWTIGIRRYKIPIQWSFIRKVTIISITASLAAYAVSAHLPALWGLIAGSIVSIIVFFGLAYLFRMLEPEDMLRFKFIANSFPPALAGPANHAFAFLSKRMAPESTAV
jgi:O-antigen/teichoic acid export membrane protein